MSLVAVCPNCQSVVARQDRQLSDQGKIAEIAESLSPLQMGLRGVWRLLYHRGMIEIHFDELCAVLRERHGESHFATVEATGTERTNEIIAKLPAHPLLDGGKALESAASVIVSIHAIVIPALQFTTARRVVRSERATTTSQMQVRSEASANGTKRKAYW